MQDTSVVDLFCGVGGLSHGFVQAGFNVIAGVDADASCRYAFEQNNDARFIAKKIEDVTWSEIANLFPNGHRRILVGCAPCQPFSTYAQKATDKSDDKQAKRNKNTQWRLLYDFAELIVDISPDFLSMENVTRLRRFKGGAVFEDFVRTLEGAGYYVSSYDVYCPDYGIPQQRTRLVLFASKYSEIKLIPETHAPEDYGTVRDAIGDVPEITHGETHPNDPIHKASSLTEINLKRIQNSKPGGTWRDWDEKLRAECHLRKSGKTYPSVYGRMSWDEPAPTLTTQCYGYGNGRFGHPNQDRAISLREAAILQTFPKDYAFVEEGERVYMNVVGRHIGNAVPPRLGEVIARSIKRHMLEAEVHL